MSGTTQRAMFEPANPAEPTGATESKKFIPEIFSPQKLAYLVDKTIRPFQIPTYTLMGTADLKVALQQMHMSAAGDEVLILIRPFIHSMPIYMRVLANKTIICFIGDSQAWQWRYYPTRNIASLLCARFGDNIKIYLSNTPFQSQGYQLGCGAFSLEMLRYFAQHGEQFIQDLLQSNCIEFNSELSEKPPQQVKLLAPNALPTHFVQAMKTAFSVATDYSEPSFPLSNINKKMQDYSIALISEIMDFEQLRHLQFFATHPEQVGIVMPLVFGQSMWIEEISNSSKNSSGSDELNHLNHSDNAQLKAKPTPAYRLNYRFETKNEFFYEMNLVFCPVRYPTEVTAANLRGFMNDNFTIDPNNHSFSITADSLDALRLKLNQCDTAIHLQVLSQQGLTQFTAFRRFIAEAKEVVDLYKIKKENKLGGLGLDCVNRALFYLLATKNTIFVPTELFNDEDLEHLQGFIINNDRYEYVVFSYAVNGDHQIAVIVDCKQKHMQLIDSEGHDYSELIKQKFHRMINFTVRSTPPFSLQKYSWSCGIHLILNVLNELQLLNKSFIDTSDFDPILRIVLRAAEHIAYE